MQKMTDKHLSIFASGSGTNALKIIEHLTQKVKANVRFTIFCNKATAGILDKGRQKGAEVVLFGSADLREGNVLNWLHERKSDLLVLAGFLWLIPPPIVSDFQGRILNIHPALLPKYGGKGMYGMRVHKAVIEAQETQSGITIHHIDTQYDQGKIIFQASCKVNPEDTPELLQKKIQRLEHTHYPKVVAQFLYEKSEFPFTGISLSTV